MNKRHYEHTLPNIRGSLSNTYCPPVGGYCVFEENACQWGLMAPDGKVVVEARYQKVEIEGDGTVRLTVIPGKVKTIKL